LILRCETGGLLDRRSRHMRLAYALCTTHFGVSGPPVLWERWLLQIIIDGCILG